MKIKCQIHVKNYTSARFWWSFDEWLKPNSLYNDKYLRLNIHSRRLAVGYIYTSYTFVCSPLTHRFLFPSFRFFCVFFYLCFVLLTTFCLLQWFFGFDFAIYFHFISFPFISIKLHSVTAALAFNIFSPLAFSLSHTQRIYFESLDWTHCTTIRPIL